jgi:hypothetical protein
MSEWIYELKPLIVSNCVDERGLDVNLMEVHSTGTSVATAKVVSHIS